MSVMVCCLAPLPGQCLTWDYAPSGSIGGQYETNPEGAPDGFPEDDGYARFISGRLDISGETQTTRLTFEPRIDSANYRGTENASDLDYVNYYLPLGAQWSSQVYQFGIDGGYSRQSTRTFSSVDPNQPDGGDITPRNIDEYQENWYVYPSASWQITPTDAVSVALGYNDDSFTKSELTNRPSSENGFSQASWSHTLTPQQKFNLAVNVSTFSAEQARTDIRNDTVTYGFDVGYQYAWSAATTMGATLGIARSDITVKGLPFISTGLGPLPCLDPVQNVFVPCELQSEDDNFVGRIFLSQRSGDTITTEFSLSRSIEPNSDGSQVTQDFAQVYTTKKFSPMLSGRLGLTYSSQQAVGADSFSGVVGQRFDRDYWNAGASLTWQLARSWAVVSAYNYSLDQLNGSFSNDVTRHRIDLFVQFTGRRHH